MTPATKRTPDPTWVATPADDSLRPTMNPSPGVLLPATVRALRDRDLRFLGTPKAVRRPPSRGLFVTDSKRLFVKVTEQDPTDEWVGARNGSASGVPGPRPLHRPIELDDGRWLLPFKWVKIDDVSPSGEQVAEVMARIWAAPAPPLAPRRHWLADADRARINVAAGAASPAMKSALLRLIDTAVGGVQDHLSGSGIEPEPVWTHGDLHSRNLAMVAGRLHVLDWELHGVSTRENEAAKYLQTLLAEPAPTHGSGDPRAFWCAVAQLGLDMDLTWRLTGVRAACAAAFQSRYAGQYPEWMALCIDLVHRTVYADPW